jgi:hypothetical protein
MRQLLMTTVLLAATVASASAEERVRFTLNTSEADAVLAILEKRAADQPVRDADWQKLFESEPYLRLKKREASMHRDFTDEVFKAFVLSSELAKKAPLLQTTLDAWKKADLRAAASRILPDLPSSAQVRPVFIR